MTALDTTIWKHLMAAISALLSGKNQTAVVETTKALKLLQSKN